MATAPKLVIFRTNGMYSSLLTSGEPTLAAKQRLLPSALTYTQQGARFLGMSVEIILEGTLGKASVEELRAILAKDADCDFIVVILGSFIKLNDRQFAI